MKSLEKNIQYVQYLSPEDMHMESQNLLLDLLFTKDEHLFFEDLVTTYTSQLIEENVFSDNKEIIDTINRSQKRNNELIELIKKHENKLEILIDGIDQPTEEKQYRNEHTNLIQVYNVFHKYYKLLKTQLFDIIISIKKEEKLRRLLDRE
jgi:hypothetical protein